MDLFDKFGHLPELRERLASAGANPFGVCMDEIVSATEALSGGRRILLAGTNNYLGLTFDPACIKRAQDAIAQHGTGTTGSRVANGTYDLHQSLERELSDFLGMSSVLVYSTGYQANLGTIAGLAGPDDTILIDADCHASIYDGCRLSGATVIRFRHNSPADLEKRLERLAPGSNKLVIIEGLYSMFVGTFSKSLGSMGGFAASNHPGFEMLRLSSRPYMFTASLSPANLAAASACLHELRSRPELRSNLWRNAHALHDGLSGLGLQLTAPPSSIVAVRMPTVELAVAFWNRLFDAGVYVNLAIPPGTPNSTSLLRCSVSAAQTPEQITRICNTFGQVAKDMDLLQPATSG